jgi:hypothetical protein
MAVAQKGKRGDLYTSKGTLHDNDRIVVYDSQDLDANGNKKTKSMSGADLKSETGFSVTENSESANFTIPDITKSEYILIMSGMSADVTVTFPTLADNLGKFLTIKNNDATYKVTMDGEGSETLDGSLTRLLTGQYEWSRWYATSSGWVMVSGAYTVNGMLYLEEKKTSAQAIPNASLTTITGLSFTPSEDGVYDIKYMVTFYNAVGSDRLCYGSLFKNATELVEAISHITFNTSTTYTHAVGTWSGPLTKTDTMVLKAYSLGGGNTNVNGSASFKVTGWTIRKTGNQ